MRGAEEEHGADPDRTQLHDRHPRVEPASEQTQRREYQQHLVDEDVVAKVTERADARR